MEKGVSILLHDIRSVHNVGSIFRTADAIGARHVFLSGYTPTPVDRFGVPRKDLAKAALGSEKTVAWTYSKTPAAIIDRFKKSGGKILALEQDERAIDYKRVKITSESLVIFGNEVSGIAESILKKADIIAEIPMRGRKESLNVSVSAGIALYRWFDYL